VNTLLGQTLAPAATDDQNGPEAFLPGLCPESGRTSSSDKSWQAIVAPYTRPSLLLSVAGVFTSVIAYAAMSVAMYLSLKISVFLTLGLSVPTAGFLLRTYIVFHDCSHGSYLPSKRANRWLGITLGVLVFAPFENWRHNHAVHHATSGDLDRRGQGDVPTLTVAEYRACSRREQISYRLFRNPLVMFGLGPLVGMIISPRIVPKSARPRIRRSVHITNVAVVVVAAGTILLVGWIPYLIVQGSTAMLAGASGIWLFYVQHQFEDVYWERGGTWSYADAALKGCSYLRLPKVLQFFTGNIGLHHVHHLSAKIPNYHLQRAHDENEIFHSVPTLTLLDGVRAVRLKLWDEDAGRLVSFAEARVAHPLAAVVPAGAPSGGA
jgi:omega-6 fatty acid desaturase (delta-12 desaturase)